MKKKGGLLLGICLALCVSSVAVSCGGNTSSDTSGSSYSSSASANDGSSSAVTPSFRLTNKLTTLNLGETRQLSLEIVGIDGTPVWTSSAPDVLAVDGNGKIEGKAKGTATITVTLGEYSDSVTVTVDDKVQPVLSSNESANVNMFVGGTYRANPTVTFNGETVAEDRITFTYETSNAEVASVASDGTVTAIATGSCEITVTANCFSRVLTTKYTVVVSENRYIRLDRGTLNLSTYQITDEQTTGTIVATVTVNGVNTDASQIVWTSSSPEVATVNGGVVTALRAGRTTVTASYSVGGETISSSCVVEVTKASTIVSTPVAFELDRPFSLPSDVSVADFTAANVSSVKENEKECLQTVDGVKTLDKNVLVGSPTAKTLTIETDKVVYTVTANVYNAIIRTADDLASLQSKLSRHDRSGNAAENGYWFDGYVVLENDIDYQGETFDGICLNKHLKPDGSSAKTNVTLNGFAGVIDGKGHTIGNIVVGDGFIGNVVKQDGVGTVQNLTFDGITVLNRAGGGVAQSFAEGRLENVTVRGKMQAYDSLGKYQAMGLVSSVLNSPAAKFVNVFAEYDGVMTQPTSAGNELCMLSVFGRMGGNYTAKALFENCVVIGQDANGNTLPLFGYGLTESTSVGYTPYYTATGAQGYTDLQTFLTANGYTETARKDATCTTAGYIKYSNGTNEYTVKKPVLGHSWTLNDGMKCANCQSEKQQLTKETDVRTEYDFAALDRTKTISSIVYDGTALTDTKLSFATKDASATPRVYEVNYTDGSVSVVNLTVWSLLMENEADMRLMKDYVVKKPVNYQTGEATTSSDYYQYIGYFKLNKDITWSNKAWTQADGIVADSTEWLKVFATEGFHGVFDGGNHTITGFITTGNHTGLINSLGTNGVVKNLNFVNVTINGGAYSHGIVAGYAHGGTIENVTIKGVNATGSNVPNMLLVGTLCSVKAGSFYKTYNYAIITGLNVTNVTIQTVNDSFGASVGEDISAIGELETEEYSTENDWTGLALPKCTNVTVTGASTLIKHRGTTETVKYTEWVGVNGKTE